MFVKWLINFESSISTNRIFLNIQYFLSQKKIPPKKTLENLNIPENNIICVEVAKVLWDKDFLMYAFLVFVFLTFNM
jgi:hypothetical protein